MMDFYTKFYDAMHKVGQRQDWKYGGGVFVRYLCNHLTFTSALDVGSGPGKGVALFQKYKKVSLGVDAATRPIQEMISRETPCCQACATYLPFQNDTWDLVLASDFMEHLRPEDVTTVLAEFCRVARRCGAMQIGLIPSKDKTLPRLAGYQYKDQHLTLWPPAQWRQVIEESCHGFLVEYFSTELEGDNHHRNKLLWVVLEKVDV